MCQSIYFVINNDDFVDQWIHVSVNMLIGTMQVPWAYLKNLHHVSVGPPAIYSWPLLNELSTKNPSSWVQQNKAQWRKGENYGFRDKG